MWCGLPIAAGVILASPAAAQDTRYRLDIAAGPLNESIAAFTAQTGISVGMPGRVPTAHVARVRGRMTAAAALDRLLRGTGLRARRLAPSVYRLEVEAARPARPVPLAASPPDAPIPDIIVTGRKQTESLSEVAAPLSVFLPDQPGLPHDSTDTADVARTTPGLITTNAGPGNNRLFIRGIADSPFSGFSQSTVAIQIDEGRATYDGPDPDLRLVDIDRGEVLKGPQGPLYGTGALGGVYRLVTRKPVLGSFSANAQAHADLVHDTQLGGGGSAVVNLPIVPDTLAIRAVGYGEYSPGWISDAALRENANWSRVAGGRLGIRYAPVSGWTLDATGLLQDIRTGDSQYVFADSETLTRTLPFREPSRSRFAMWSGALKGPVGKLDLTVAASLVRQQFHRILDASDAADAFALTAPLRFFDDRHYGVFDGEIRVEDNARESFRWMAGLSYLNASSTGTGTLDDALDRRSVVVDVRRIVREIATFGQIDLRPLSGFTASLGARLFLNEIEDDRDRETKGTETNIFVGFSPSVSLGWKPSDPLLVYFRYASAVRPGGVADESAGTRYDADVLDNFDLGLRYQSASGRWMIDAAAYRSAWRHVQSDYLLDNGLVATRNAGDSYTHGLDFSVQWLPVADWKIAAGLSVQRARLEESAQDVEISSDRRMPIVPDISGHARIQKQFDMGSWHPMVGIDATFVGKTRLSFDPGLDRKTPAYAILGADISAGRAGWSIALAGTNLLDIRGDSFAFGNQFSIFQHAQYTPLRPRMVRLTVSRSY